MRYASLASGSRGNCHAINDGERILLIDAGIISLLEIWRRLESIGWSYHDVRGVAITHAHSDHIRAVRVILYKTNWTILATESTLHAIEEATGWEVPKERWVPLMEGHGCNWGGWLITPWPVPHDAESGTNAFRIEAGGVRVAVITDLGMATESAFKCAKDVELLVLEANYDEEMLRNGRYPPKLKRRILSRSGHLSNDDCAKALAKMISPALRHVVLAHLSDENNYPELAMRAAAKALRFGDSRARLHVASQNEVLEIQI